MKRTVVGLAVAIALIAAYIGGMKMSWFTNNVAQTGEGIEPLRLDVTPDRAVEKIVATIKTMERWKVEKVEGNIVHATRTTRLFGFIDDITLTVEGEGDGSGSLIHARSASRLGVGDFGQNERNIRELWGEVAK
ncbi:MAG: DUF1499 domain-containing protein [Nitrospinae bacterium]|nr:DUF1499 domain-containing protein [Nitrospinota bacterium]